MKQEIFQKFHAIICKLVSLRGGVILKILVGAATKADIIKDTILTIHEPSFTYCGKDGMYMVFESADSEKDLVRLVKDTLKANPELNMVYFNVTAGN